MKTTDIVIKEKCIVLGIFGTDTFRHFDNKKTVNNSFIASYHNFKDIIGGDVWMACNSITQVVRATCLKVDQIIFCLDGVQFPIDPSRSHTCSELEMVCKNNKIFNKTIFVKEDNVIEFDKNLI